MPSFQVPNLWSFVTAVPGHTSSGKTTARLPLGPPSTQGVHWARPGVMRQPGLRRLGVPWGAVVSTRASRRRKLAHAERVVHRGVKANSVWLLEGNEENLPTKLP